MTGSDDRIYDVHSPRVTATSLNRPAEKPLWITAIDRKVTSIFQVALSLVPRKNTLACIRNQALPLPDQLTDCVTHLDVLVCLLFWRFTNFGHGLGI